MIETKNNSLKVIGFFIRLLLALFIIGILFKIMHWPFANILILASSLGIIILYPIRFYLNNNKETLNYVKLFLVPLWFVLYVSKTLHLINTPRILNIILLVLFGWWFVLEGTSYFKDKPLKNNRFTKALYYIFLLSTISLVIIGFLFKLQHWPYGALILTIGMLSASILVIVDYLVRD